MSDKGSMRSWKAFAGTVWAQFGAPSDRDLDRIWGRRHKVAPRASASVDGHIDQHLAPQPVQEPARI